MPRTLIDALDSNALRVGAYLVAAAVAMWWGARERRYPDEQRVGSWPLYWFISAAVLAIMGLARSLGVAEVLGEVGREQARSGGWYDARRAFQAAAVGVVATVWMTTVVLAILRVPPRRRRYLPHVVMLSAIVAFAGIRLISLHHIDTLLYRRDIGDVRVVAIVELLLLILSLVVGLITSRRHDGTATRPSSTDQPTRSGSS